MIDQEKEKLKELVKNLLHQIEICDYQTTDILHELKWNKAYLDLKVFVEVEMEKPAIDA